MDQHFTLYMDAIINIDLVRSSKWQTGLAAVAPDQPCTPPPFAQVVTAWQQSLHHVAPDLASDKVVDVIAARASRATIRVPGSSPPR